MVTRRKPSSDDVPLRPLIKVVLTSGGGMIDGRPITVPARANAREVLLAHTKSSAVALGRPVRVEVRDDSHREFLITHLDGTFAPCPDPRARSRRPARRSRPPGPGLRPIERDHHEIGPPRTSAPTDVPVGYVAADTPTHPRSPAELRDPTDPDEPDYPTGPDDPTGPEDAGHRSHRRALRWPGLFARGMAVGVMLGIVATLAMLRMIHGDGMATHTVAQGTPAIAAATAPALPVSIGLPPGYARTPAWGVAVAAWTTSCATDGGIVLSRDPQGHVILVDPVDGGVVWRSSEKTDRDEVGPWPTTIDGARAAAVVSADRLTYWALPGTPLGKRSPTIVSAGRTIDLPEGSKVTFEGRSPLVHVPDGSVAVLHDGALVGVSIPQGARALSADGDTVLAATSTEWVREEADQAPALTRPLPRPAGVAAGPLRLEAVGSTMVLVLWPTSNGSGLIAALLSTRLDANLLLDRLPITFDPTVSAVREVGGDEVAVGPIVVDTYARKFDLLDSRYTVRALARGRAWTMFQGRATAVGLTAVDQFPTAAFGPGAPAIPVGVTHTSGGTRAVLVAPTSAGSGLFGLPATS